MPSLNKAKRQTQIILKWTSISIGIIFIFLMGTRFLAFVQEILTPPPPPQASFGKLPAISFPNQRKVNIIYTLNTLTGFLPNFSDRAKVYKITQSQPTLLALDKAREKVAKIGFTSNETKIAEDVYQWAEKDPLQRRITVNIFSLDFTLSSAYLVTPIVQTFDSDEKNSAIFTAKSFLSDISQFSEDLDIEKTKTTVYSIEKGTLSPTSKFSDAKIIKVDFFQKDLDKLPIYYENGISSTMNFIVGKQDGELKVLDARFSHKNISQEQSTYAIKSATLAFTQLKEGKAYIAYKDPNTVEITIKKVLLGYYIEEGEQDFLMPVVVFEGDDDFIAYVSAVRDEWISN